MPVNLDLWLKSYEANPEPNLLYTTQINSTFELRQRVQAICGTKPGSEEPLTIGLIDKASSRLSQIVSKLKELSDTKSQQLQDSIDLSKQKNIQIMRRLIRIFGKFESLMHYENRVDNSDTRRRDILLEAQKSLL